VPGTDGCPKETRPGAWHRDAWHRGFVYPRRMPTKEDVVEALRQVEDPELGMDIVELGLFYDAEVEGPNVKVTYTLTSMGCPAGAMIQEDIDRVLYEIPGVEGVQSELTFDPPWTPDRMSDDAKFILGFG
jgi:metal-sulfur cluster biosynthetic enzyme